MLVRTGRWSWIAQASSFVIIVLVLARNFRAHIVIPRLSFAFSTTTTDDKSFPHGSNKTLQQTTIRGFTNLALLDDFNCSDIISTNELSITSATDIDDDLLDIAESVAHPLIDYSGQDKSLHFKAMVAKTWGRMGGSSVWLEEYQVYLTISRVFFYDKGVKKWSIISFVRAQIHDQYWNEIKGFELEWQGENITFPRTYDMKVPYETGGAFYGPEDPRIIIEHGVRHAEPVIVFNMVEDMHTKRRVMFVFRPFSGSVTKLDLNPSGNSEKNWAPFFLESSTSADGTRWPNHWLHFVYEFQPLTILRCNLFDGACSRAFQQKLPADFDSKHRYRGGVLRGGSNFEPLHINQRPGIMSFAGFPRTHIEEGCSDEAIYRLELTILSTNGTEFWFDYSSESLNFGSAILNETQLAEPCTIGRIMFINSIAYLDAKSRDEMTVTFSVDDASVGVVSIRGVRQLVESLPQYNTELWRDEYIPQTENVTHRLVGCTIESATDYALENTTPQMWEDKRVKLEKEQREKEKQEQEKKKKKKEMQEQEKKEKERQEKEKQEMQKRG